MARLWLALAVASRLRPHNASSAMLPPLLFTAVACVHYRIPGLAFVLSLATA